MKQRSGYKAHVAHLTTFTSCIILCSQRDTCTSLAGWTEYSVFHVAGIYFFNLYLDKKLRVSQLQDD